MMGQPMHMEMKHDEDGNLLVWCKDAQPHCWVAVIDGDYGRLCGYCMADISARFKRAEEAVA